MKNWYWPWDGYFWLFLGGFAGWALDKIDGAPQEWPVVFVPFGFAVFCLVMWRVKGLGKL